MLSLALKAKILASRDTSYIIRQLNLLCQAYSNKTAELGENNRTCRPEWEVVSVQVKDFSCKYPW